MTRLIKNVTTTYIPATPGQAGTPYIPAQPARTVPVSVTRCGLTYPYTWIRDDKGVLHLVALTSGYACTTTTSYRYVPAALAVPATPYVAPTAAQTIVWKNSGWNSYARTIGQLAVGSYLEFRVANFTRGALVAVDVQGREGVGYTTLAHGLMVDQSGVYVFENGVSTLLVASWTNTTLLRIFRLADGRIVYATNSSKFHISAVTPNVGTPLYVYGLLYDGYDEITSSEFKTGSISVNLQAAFTGTSTFSARAQSRAAFDAGSSFTAQAGIAGEVVGLFSGAGTLVGTAKNGTAEALLSGSSYVFAEALTGGMATASLPQMLSLGGDYDYSVADGSLPFFTTNAEGGFYVPPALTEGYGQLPLLVSYAIGWDNDSGESTLTLPYFLAIGDGHSNADAPFNGSGYGVSDATLPTMYQANSSGYVADDELWLLSGAVAVDTFTPVPDLVMVLTSSGAISSTFSLNREQALALMNSISGSSLFTLSGTFALSLLSSSNVASSGSFQVGDRPDMLPEGVVWVVNMSNDASSQYEDYGFNSFFERDGSYYGVAGDGIYKLEGATDAGLEILSTAVLGKSDFGNRKEKRVPAVYVGASSAGALLLKVNADGAEYTYEARSYSDALAPHRVDIGKGVRGRYWQFTALNNAGCDFELESIDFTQVITSRSI